MQALILAGGLGTRLASVVSDRSKVVADVAGKPFLQHVLGQLERCADVDDIVLCVGHKAESIRSRLGTRHGRLPLRYSLEDKPLGTGGALRHALSRVPARGGALALNGDSYLGISLPRLVEFHRRRGAWVTLALARVAEASRFGAAQLQGDRVTAFSEKGRSGPGWINGGIYVLSDKAIAALRGLPEAFSFEREALAPWCAAGRVSGMKSRARFLDIGTPADYARSPAVLGRR